MDRVGELLDTLHGKAQLMTRQVNIDPDNIATSMSDYTPLELSFFRQVVSRALAYPSCEAATHFAPDRGHRRIIPRQLDRLQSGA